jgi:hypothetical protein
MNLHKLELNKCINNPISLLYGIGLYSILNLSYKYFIQSQEIKDLKIIIKLHSQEINHFGLLIKHFYSTIIKLKRDQNTILRNLNYNSHSCDESDDIDDSGFQNNNKLNIKDLVIMFDNNINGSNNEKENEKEKDDDDDDLTDKQLYEYISSLETKNILVKNKNNDNDKNQMYHFLSYIFKIA